MTLARKLVLTYHYTRCGSTALMSALGANEGVHSAGEVLNPSTAWGQRFAARNAHGDSGKPSRHLVEIVRELFTQRPDTHIAIEVTSFDLHSQRVELPLQGLVRMLADEFPCEVVHLYRCNVLERALSSMVAEQSRVWHRRGTTAEPAPITLDFDIAKLRNAVWHQSSRILRDKVLLACMNPVAVEYETDVRDDIGRGLNKILGRLGLPVTSVETDFRPLPPLSQRLTNWSALRSALIEAGLADFLPAEP
mgnify:CR=1 FL=1